MGLHISVNFGHVAQPRPYYWQPVRVMPVYPLAFVQQPVIFRPPMTYGVMQFHSEPYQMRTRHNPSLGEFAGGMGVLAATARYGVAGLFCSLAALAAGKSIYNSLENKHTAAAPHVETPAVRTPAVASVDMSRIPINGLDLDTPSAGTTVADASRPNEAEVQRRRSLDMGHGFG